MRAEGEKDSIGLKSHPKDHHNLNFAELHAPEFRGDEAFTVAAAEPDMLESGQDAMIIPVSEMSLKDLSISDRRNFYFLTFLYFIQGVPVGLAFGSIPFILKERLSYSQIGIFSLATYPYSLKLLWSPIVDAIYSRSFGRRRSWIVPVQLFSAFVLFALSFRISHLMETASSSLVTLTIMFTTLVMGSATQDIAVDGWSLTLLSEPALPYASTAQTIGINTGYFTSFTVFLSLSSPEFANKYFRSQPDISRGLITLPEYLFLCSVVFLIATALAAFGRRRDPPQSSLDESVSDIYGQMVKILRLPAVQSLLVVHMLAKIAFQCADQVTNLKLVEHGLSKEDLALVVLADFPFEILCGYFAAQWSTGKRPLQPWKYAYLVRLGFVGIGMLQVYFFPAHGINFWYLLFIMSVHIITQFLSTLQFVSINAFHTRISDPEIGGTYMTVLNTIANLGGQWPRALVLWGVDLFTDAKCTASGESCVAQAAKDQCSTLGGKCVIYRDGYYIMNCLCITIGLLLFHFFLRRAVENLQSLRPSAWRATTK